MFGIIRIVTKSRINPICIIRAPHLCLDLLRAQLCHRLLLLVPLACILSARTFQPVQIRLDVFLVILLQFALWPNAQLVEHFHRIEGRIRAGCRYHGAGGTAGNGRRMAALLLRTIGCIWRQFMPNLLLQPVAAIGQLLQRGLAILLLWTANGHFLR